jgi:hypothetical protein
MLMMVGANATIGSTGNKDVGLVYAPNGKVTFDGTTGLTSKGSAVARDITLQGVTNSPVLLRPRIRAVDVPAAPASSFIAPPPPRTTPPTPTQTFPSNGTTLPSNAYCVQWSGTSQAYRFEVNGSATFAASGRLRPSSSTNDRLVVDDAPISGS